MPKGKPNKRYTGEFKQMVVETMRKEGLSYKEAERQFELPHMRAATWDRIYLEEGRWARTAISRSIRWTGRGTFWPRSTGWRRRSSCWRLRHTPPGSCPSGWRCAAASARPTRTARSYSWWTKRSTPKSRRRSRKQS